MLRQRRERARQVLALQHLGGLLGHWQVVLGQVAAVGSRVGQRLVLLVQRLRQGQRGLGREAEARVGLALQRRQVVEAGAGLGAGLAFLGHRGRLALHRGGNALGLGLVPEPIGARLGVVALLEVGLDVLAVVLAGLRIEGRAHFPVVARHVLPDLLLALDDDRQRRRLHAAHRGQEEAAVAAVERGHRPRAVDADQPVGLGAAARRIGQRQQLLIGAQVRETVADRLRRHALQPEPLHGLVQRPLGRLRVLQDQPEDQLALAARVTGVDDAVDILAADQLYQRVEPALALVDRLQVEVRRDHRQVGEAPLAALGVHAFRRGNLHQVADGRADDVLLVLMELVVLLELAALGGQRPDDVQRDRGLFGDDQRLHAHEFPLC